MNKREFKKLNPREVKAQFILRGTTMREWAKKNGHPVSSVSMALHGNRKGKQSQEILRKLERLVTK